MFDVFDILGITQLMEWGKKVIGIDIKPQYHPEQVTPTSCQPESGLCLPWLSEWCFRLV